MFVRENVPAVWKPPAALKRETALAVHLSGNGWSDFSNRRISNTKGPFTHAIFDAISGAISRTKRALPYLARIFVSWSIAWIGKKVITYDFKAPFFPISANLAVFLSQSYATTNSCGVGCGSFCSQNRIKIASKSHEKSHVLTGLRPGEVGRVERGSKVFSKWLLECGTHIIVR